MRARTDQKESSRSMSKESRALERSSSASPGGGGGTDDRQSLSDTAPLQRTTAAASLKGQDEVSGRPPERGVDRQV